MKKSLPIILLILFVSVTGINIYAHSGGTDSNGGHYNYDTGDYHYHHGFPAHEHTNGKCPYENKDPIYNNDEKADFSWLIWVFLIALVLIPIIYLHCTPPIPPHDASFKPKPQSSHTTPTAVSSKVQENSAYKQQQQANKSTVQASISDSRNLTTSKSSPPTSIKSYTPSKTNNIRPLTVSTKNHVQGSTNNQASTSKSVKVNSQTTTNKETGMLQTTIYPPSKPPSLSSYPSSNYDEILKLKKGNDFLNKKVDELNRKIVNANNENNKLKNALAKAEEENKRLQTQADSVANDDAKESLKNENEKLKKEIAILKEKQTQPNTELLKSLQQKKNETENLLSEIRILKNKLRYIESICPDYEKIFSSDFEGTLNISNFSNPVPKSKPQEKATEKKEYVFSQETKDIITSSLKQIIPRNCNIDKMYDSVLNNRLNNAFNTNLSMSELHLSAKINSNNNMYNVTLSKCDCPDFKFSKNNAPCKHMLYLAYNIGVLQAYPEKCNDALNKLNSQVNAQKSLRK